MLSSIFGGDLVIDERRFLLNDSDTTVVDHAGVQDPAGSDFHGMRFLAGGEEGRSMLYYENQFPSGAICPVTFMWRPLQADERTVDAATGSSKFELRTDWQESKRQLWLWIHPAAFMEAAGAVASACQTVVDGSDDEYGARYCEVV